MNLIEWIKDGEEALALIVRHQYIPAATEFLTPDSYKQQVGFIVYKEGQKISPHDHKPLQRNLVGTSEALIVKKGKVEAHIYSRKREFVKTVTLVENDLILLIAGGHGFKMLEDAIMIEIKQGPYTGLEEKERFDW
jgi:hypothetical protein